ncbi:ADP-ribosylglycohydrolase family protein [Thermococcus pacificus]|nr:ADP-ribosylglycohydrolase family protein [Thermococcus pacificus]
MDVLFEEDLINAEQSKLLYSKPKLIDRVQLSKVRGMLLGVPIGDALGSPFEGRPPSEENFRMINDYLPEAHITDDTQLTFWTLEVFSERGWFDPKALADRFSSEWIIGIGGSVRRFIRNYKDLGKPWYLSGVESAGNGALMRLSPVVIPHLLNPTRELWSDAVITIYLTHNDRLAISSSVAFTNILWELFMKDKPPEPEWWVEEYVSVAREVEGDFSRYSPRFGKFKSYSGPAWEFVEKTLEKALSSGWSLLDLNTAVGSGAYLLETVPMVLYTMMLYADDPTKAITMAVSSSKDSDTVGAIVGYLVGALHGVKAFPEHLLAPVLNGNLMPRTFVDLVVKVETFLMNPAKGNVLNGHIWR